MFWADRCASAIEERFSGRIKKRRKLIIRDEKTVSGKVHIGAMRGVAIHGIISEILSEKGIENEYLYEINDFDPFDDIPAYLDKEKYKPYLGQPLCSIPSPDGQGINYAESVAVDFIGAITKSKFTPTLYRSSQMYKEGRYNEAIKIALERADDIRRIYREVSGSQKAPDWSPVQVICERCGKLSTTKILAFDGERVKYRCEPQALAWTTGCGGEGEISPFNGNAKLPWKVEWAAKFKIFGVDIEGGGKDHSTRGGARDVANHIAREIFDYEPPFDIPYEFILVGGKKMSSSKGRGSSASEVAELLPETIFRLLLIGKDPKQTAEFIPDGDTVPVLFDTYDRLVEASWSQSNSMRPDREEARAVGTLADDSTRLFSLIHFSDSTAKKPGRSSRLSQRFLPRFSTIAFIVQMPHLDVFAEVEKMKGSPLTDLDREEIKLRVEYARRWLDAYAPEDYKYVLQTENVPEGAKNLSSEQKQALRKVLEYIQSNKKLDGPALHAKLHEIKTEDGIEPKKLFSAIYLAFLGRDSGPQAGWFLSVLDRKFLEKRLEEVSA